MKNVLQWLEAETTTALQRRCLRIQQPLHKSLCESTQNYFLTLLVSDLVFAFVFERLLPWTFHTCLENLFSKHFSLPSMSNRVCIPPRWRSWSLDSFSEKSLTNSKMKKRWRKRSGRESDREGEMMRKVMWIEKWTKSTAWKSGEIHLFLHWTLFGRKEILRSRRNSFFLPNFLVCHLTNSFHLLPSFPSFLSSIFTSFMSSLLLSQLIPDKHFFSPMKRERMFIPCSVRDDSFLWEQIFLLYSILLWNS